MELSPEQLLIIGFVITVLSAGLKLLSAKFGVALSKFWMTIVVAVVSVILAVVFNLPLLPEYIDPLQYIGAWFALLSGYVGAAMIIYNLILDKVLDKLDLTADRFMKKT